VVGLLLRSVRVFSQFAWLEVGSVKVTSSRSGRAPGWFPIPPTSTPRGHNANHQAQQDAPALRDPPQHLLILKPDPTRSAFRRVTRFVLQTTL
jgi:hypothetical protein